MRSAETRAASALLMTHNAEEAAAQHAAAAVQAEQKARDAEQKAARLQAQLDTLQQDLRARTEDSQQQLQVGTAHAGRECGRHGLMEVLWQVFECVQGAAKSCRWNSCMLRLANNTGSSSCVLKVCKLRLRLMSCINPDRTKANGQQACHNLCHAEWPC